MTNRYNDYMCKLLSLLKIAHVVVFLNEILFVKYRLGLYFSALNLKSF